MTGLEDLYREIILDHYRSPRNRGELRSRLRTGRGLQPALRRRGRRLPRGRGRPSTDLKISGQGCSISQSSASMMSAAVKGKHGREARELIRSFKAMMSIHEHSIGGERQTPSTATADEARPPVEDLGELAALQGRREVPGSDQVRHAVVEHPRCRGSTRSTPGCRPRADGTHGLWAAGAQLAGAQLAGAQLAGGPLAGAREHLGAR